MGRLFGTDGVRGVANGDLTAELALALGSAAARLGTYSGRHREEPGTPTRRLAGKLRRLGSVRLISLFATKEQARAAVDRRLPLTDRVQLGQLPPLTWTLFLSTLLCGEPVATLVAPELYQFPENVLSFVLLVPLALVNAHTPLSCTTLADRVT